MIRIMKGMSLFVLALVLCLGTGCNDNGDDNSGSDGDSVGSYAGTWKGNVCGRGLTMQITQNGNSLSGSYTLTDPTFTESFSGNVNSKSAADLMGGGGRMFAITFNGNNSFSGGYFKSGTKVCDVKAKK